METCEQASIQGAVTNIGVHLWQPEDVENNFPFLRTVCANVIAPGDEASWFRLYHRLMSKTMFTYFITGNIEETPVVVAVVVLEHNHDSVTNEGTLNIWNFFGYRDMTEEQFETAFKFLLDLARSLNVKTLSAVTPILSLVAVAKKLGATAQRMLVWRIE